MVDIIEVTNLKNSINESIDLLNFHWYLKKEGIPFKSKVWYKDFLESNDSKFLKLKKSGVRLMEVMDKIILETPVYDLIPLLENIIHDLRFTFRRFNKRFKKKENEIKDIVKEHGVRTTTTQRRYHSNNEKYAKENNNYLYGESQIWIGVAYCELILSIHSSYLLTIYQLQKTVKEIKDSDLSKLDFPSLINLGINSNTQEQILLDENSLLEGHTTIKQQYIILERLGVIEFLRDKYKIDKSNLTRLFGKMLNRSIKDRNHITNISNHKDPTYYTKNNIRSVHEIFEFVGLNDEAERLLKDTGIKL